jgi:hypothetical protein
MRVACLPRTSLTLTSLPLIATFTSTTDAAVAASANAPCVSKSTLKESSTAADWIQLLRSCCWPSGRAAIVVLLAAVHTVCRSCFLSADTGCTCDLAGQLKASACKKHRHSTASFAHRFIMFCTHKHRPLQVPLWAFKGRVLPRVSHFLHRSLQASKPLKTSAAAPVLCTTPLQSTLCKAPSLSLQT